MEQISSARKILELFKGEKERTEQESNEEYNNLTEDEKELIQYILEMIDKEQEKYTKAIWLVIEHEEESRENLIRGLDELRDNLSKLSGKLIEDKFETSGKAFQLFSRVEKDEENV